jgi:hypothetical protein
LEQAAQDGAPVVPPSVNPAQAIRTAYLRNSGGSYKTRVLLKDLRPELQIPREQQDAALMEMIRSGEADLYPEDDPESRDERDDQAALMIGDRPRHLMILHPRTIGRDRARSGGR